MIKKLTKSSGKSQSSRSERKLFWKFAKKQPRIFQKQTLKELLWNRLEIVGFGHLSFRRNFEVFPFFIFPPWSKLTNLVYFETVSPIILAALWTMCILWTISVLLWTITMINFNCALQNLRTKRDFNFVNFLVNRVIRPSTKGATHCCFHKSVSMNYFQNFSLINFLELAPIGLTISVLLTFCWVKAMGSILYEMSWRLLLS